jgi:hypothetical protein
VGKATDITGLPRGPHELTSQADPPLPTVEPILLTPRRDPFDDPAWLFEPNGGYRGCST